MKVIMDESKFDPECAARHITDWMLEPMFARRAIAMVRDGTWRPEPLVVPSSGEHIREAGVVLFTVEDGIATIPIVGPSMKGDSKFGGTNTLRTRRALRRSTTDASIGGVMLHFDSPGGTSAGNDEVVDEIRKTRKVKPVFGHAEGMMASAAFYMGSPVEYLTATQTTEVGSIGTVAVVEDSSGAAEMAGVTVYIISTGEFKGAFADGAPVRPEDLDMLQERVDDLFEHFMKAVSVGRKMSMSAVRAIADGRVHIASKAKELGLIDAVMTADQAMAGLRRRVAVAARVNKANAKIGASR